jgi:SAM-dependent methyltransferase
LNLVKLKDLKLNITGERRILNTRPFQYTVDAPALNQVIEGMSFILRGWIIANKGSLLEEPALYNKDTLVCPLATVPRPDVEAAYPNHTVLGFHQYIEALSLPTFTRPCIQFLLNKQKYSFPVSLTFSARQSILLENLRKQKQAKLQKIRQILRCPLCSSENLKDLVKNLECLQCHTVFGVSQRCYNFLSPELIAQSGVEATANVSSNGYDPIALGLIEQFQDGLLLDNGCGLRDTYYPNVVNFEIVDYSTTDVLGVGEHLPFKSNVFDAVFSLAVLEHVKDPFESAREISRVLKPGGTLYVAVPFLQPFHGYPNHYYNMTSSGLRNLFDKDLHIVECGVPLAGLPIWCLSWFLNSYIAGLPPEQAERFKNLKISELTKPGISYLDEDYVTQLNSKTNEELACVNYLLAKK